MKVAILDSGFRGYRAHLGKALPDTVLVQSFRADSNLEAKDSQHGILCGEVVHALAPEANLLFANWDPDKPEQFLQAARWARSGNRMGRPAPAEELTGLLFADTPLTRPARRGPRALVAKIEQRRPELQLPAKPRSPLKLLR